MDDSTKIIETSTNLKDGQNKCPNCGSTEINLNINTGKLKCLYCRTEFEPIKEEKMQSDISQLEGSLIGSGASDISNDDESVITLKCSSCSAEVVIDTNDSTQAKCHWCRNVLSINSKVPNGAVPDVVLPFKVSKEEARNLIANFVKKRSFFANSKFKKEFKTENISGVYFPYMLVDLNSHAHLTGLAEHEVRRYTVKVNDRSETRYDAEVYEVGRDFDLRIKSLSVESNSDKLDFNDKSKTNNIINSIMPFDTENCVAWNANYIKGFSSEKRDVNVNELRPYVFNQAKDVAKLSVNDSLKQFDRGVSWKEVDLHLLGDQWKAAYLPVWLYSYHQKKGNRSIVHYVAVNGRTKETMGSVPINYAKLYILSILIEIFSIFCMLNVELDDGSWIFLTPGFIFFFVFYFKYRNADKRHYHELETKREVNNLKVFNKYIKTNKGLRNSKIEGINNIVSTGGLNSVINKTGLNTVLGNDNISDIIKK